MKKLLLSVFSVAFFLSMSLVGCGDNNQAAQIALVFVSNGALDASDFVNTNETFNIWSVNSDDTGLTPLTELTAEGADNFDPEFSHNGRRVTWRSSRALDGSDAANTNGTFNIWVMDVNGSDQEVLTELTADNADSFVPQFSPDGNFIIFQSRRALDGSDAANTNETNNIWIMNADGSNQTPLTELTANDADSFGPEFSPDGEKIMFRSQRTLNGSDAANTNGTGNIWIMDVDGSNQTPLTELTANDVDVFNTQISPDGTKVVFRSARALNGADAANTNNTFNVWIMDVDGSGETPLTELTTNGADSFVPTFSPDGTQIVYQSARALDGSDAANTNNTGNVWITNLDGSVQEPLTESTVNAAGCFDPRFLPNGTQISFGSERNLDGSDSGNTNDADNIWVMNADGSVEEPLTDLSEADTEAFGQQPVP